ncbi:hypothetical protein [Priestia koreensis]|nr:hypothetical protein [Priestia koreensis]
MQKLVTIPVKFSKYRNVIICKYLLDLSVGYAITRKVLTSFLLF